jgi:hypothetical protein
VGPALNLTLCTRAPYVSGSWEPVLWEQLSAHVPPVSRACTANDLTAKGDGSTPAHLHQHWGLTRERAVSVAAFRTAHNLERADDLRLLLEVNKLDYTPQDPSVHKWLLGLAASRLGTVHAWPLE